MNLFLTDVDIHPLIGQLYLWRDIWLHANELQWYFDVGPGNGHLGDEMPRSRQPGDKDFIDIAANPQVLLGGSHHHKGIKSEGIRIVGSLGGGIAAMGDINREHHSIDRSLERVFSQENQRRLVGKTGSGALLALILDLIAPGTCFG